MDLKNYLKQTIDKRIDYLKDNLQKAETSEILLRKNSLDNAQYKVFIKSAWSQEGEKDVTHKSSGSLSDVIKHAEKKFEKLNNRDGAVDGQYLVSIILGEETVDIPKKYWSKYIRKS